MLLRYREERICLVAFALLCFPTCAVAPSSEHGELTVKLHQDASVPMGRDLTLHATSVGDFGWELAVHEGNDVSNLLYHSTWHGPYFTRILAGTYLEILSVSGERWFCLDKGGPPYEVHAVVKDYAIRGRGPEAIFERGRLLLKWWKRPCTEH